MHRMPWERRDGATPIGAVMGYRRWSSREEATLLKLKSLLADELIAERLGRSVMSVACKARRLGKKKFTVHGWTVEELAAVSAHPRGAPRKPLADRLGLDVQRVGSMVASMRRKQRLGVLCSAP
jgi:hypothetical protein